MREVAAGLLVCFGLFACSGSSTGGTPGTGATGGSGATGGTAGSGGVVADASAGAAGSGMAGADAGGWDGQATPCPDAVSPNAPYLACSDEGLRCVGPCGPDCECGGSPYHPGTWACTFNCVDSGAWPSAPDAGSWCDCGWSWSKANTCGLSATCDGAALAVECDGSLCRCVRDGKVTRSFKQPASCSDPALFQPSGYVATSDAGVTVPACADPAWWTAFCGP